MFSKDVCLQQLTQCENPSNRLKCMLGTKKVFYCNLDNYIQFDFKGNRKMNSCKIVLNGKDLYDMFFYRMSKKLNKEASEQYGGKIYIAVTKEIDQINDVYCEFNIFKI